MTKTICLNTIKTYKIIEIKQKFLIIYEMIR